VSALRGGGGDRACAPIAERGQASVELVAILPLALIVTLAVAQVLAAGAAREQAGLAAQAGAAALLQDGDPKAEARAAVPGRARDRVDVTVTGRRVRVVVEPRALVPGIAGLLVARATADAGPAAAAGGTR
jgi:hypothetical protein